VLAAWAARRPGLRVLFADEAWWGLTTAVGKVWTRGARPVLAVSGGRSWAPVMAAVEPATGRLHRLIAGRFDARWFGYFLAEVAAAYPGERAILVGDNAGWHRARGLRVPPNVILWFLPPHCPEANPVEQVWQWLRDHRTRGILFPTRAALLDALCDGLVALLDDPLRVRSLTARAHRDAVDTRIST
jgi:transposase